MRHVVYSAWRVFSSCLVIGVWRCLFQDMDFERHATFSFSRRRGGFMEEVRRRIGMFRVKGKERQDRTWYENTIRRVAEIDLGAAIILSPTYFEWCIRRSILALGSSSVHDLACELKNPKLSFEKLVELWNREVSVRFVGEEKITLSLIFDQCKNKPKFQNHSLTWQNIQRARKVRHAIVHSDRCSPLEPNGRKYVELLIAASAILSDLVEKNGRSIFSIIRRTIKLNWVYQTWMYMILKNGKFHSNTLKNPSSIVQCA